MQAIILCGGLGTRLRSVVSEVPKSMAPVGDRPFMQIQVDKLVDAGVTKIVFAVGYKKEVIRNFFGDEYKGVALVYSEEDSPLKTGGAMAQALKFIDDDCALILNGDTYTTIDYRDMMRQHKNSGAVETLAAKPMDNFDRFGNIVLSDHDMTIIDFIEKQPTAHGNVNIGVYILNKNIFDEYAGELGRAFSHELDYLSKHLHDRKHCAYLYDGYYVDIGIPDDYFAFCDYIKRNIR